MNIEKNTIIDAIKTELGDPDLDFTQKVGDNKLIAGDLDQIKIFSKAIFKSCGITPPEMKPGTESSLQVSWNTYVDKFYQVMNNEE